MFQILRLSKSISLDCSDLYCYDLTAFTNSVSSFLSLSLLQLLQGKSIHYPSGYPMTRSPPFLVSSSPGPDPYRSMTMSTRSWDLDALTPMGNRSRRCIPMMISPRTSCRCQASAVSTRRRMPQGNRRQWAWQRLERLTTNDPPAAMGQLQGQRQPEWLPQLPHSCQRRSVTVCSARAHPPGRTHQQRLHPPRVTAIAVTITIIITNLQLVVISASCDARRAVANCSSSSSIGCRMS